MISYENLRVDAEAALEITKAFEWYERKSDGLGERFYIEVQKAFDRIIKNPSAYSKIKRHIVIRRINLFHFPYKIFYDPLVKPIRIIAVIHAARSPKYIRTRIK
jgi:plasmid stabilization system protein ParE